MICIIELNCSKKLEGLLIPGWQFWFFFGHSWLSLFKISSEDWLFIKFCKKLSPGLILVTSWSYIRMQRNKRLAQGQK